MHCHSCFTSGDFTQSLQKLRKKCPGFVLWKAKLSPQMRELCTLQRACELGQACRVLIINMLLLKAELPFPADSHTSFMWSCPVLVYSLFLPLTSTHSSPALAESRRASPSLPANSTLPAQTLLFQNKLFFQGLTLFLFPWAGRGALLLPKEYRRIKQKQNL